jgi:hypothetical protein
MFTLSSDEVRFCFGAATMRCDEDWPGGLTGPPLRLPIRLEPWAALEFGTLWWTLLDPYGPAVALLDVWLPLWPDYWRLLYYPGVTITFWTLLLIERFIVGFYILFFFWALINGDLDCCWDTEDGPWWFGFVAPLMRFPTLGVWWLWWYPGVPCPWWIPPCG